MPEELLKVSEVAKLLNVSTMAVYKWIKAKKIKAYRINRHWRIPKKEVERLLKEVE